MLRAIGRHARPATTTTVAALGDCHARIRGFIALARGVAGAAPDAFPGAELQAACADVERYFRQALPLHVADEDELLWPLLVAAHPDAAEGLARLSAQHLDHAPLVVALLAALAHVRGAPHAIEARADLAAAVNALDDALTPHLRAEEDLAFPLLERLGEADHARLLEAMAARRRPAAP